MRSNKNQLRNFCKQPTNSFNVANSRNSSLYTNMHILKFTSIKTWVLYITMERAGGHAWRALSVYIFTYEKQKTSRKRCERPISCFVTGRWPDLDSTNYTMKIGSDVHCSCTFSRANIRVFLRGFSIGLCVVRILVFLLYSLFIYIHMYIYTTLSLYIYPLIIIYWKCTWFPLNSPSIAVK